MQRSSLRTPAFCVAPSLLLALGTQKFAIMRRSSRLSRKLLISPNTSRPAKVKPRTEMGARSQKSPSFFPTHEPQIAAENVSSRDGNDSATTGRSPKRAKVEKSVTPAKSELTKATVCDIEEAIQADRVTKRPSATEARETLENLAKQYGRRTSEKKHPKQEIRPVLDSLIATILSQATSNVNSARAFKSLKNSFPLWDLAIKAGPQAIADSIRVGGLADAKGKRIHAILEELRAVHGECTLEHLRGVDDEEAKRVLCEFPGVGPKTAACVLMFGMGRAEFPVDTHVRRITTRLGWVPEGWSAEAVYDVLNAVLPPDVKYDLHVLLIEHGRALCNARSPKCGECPIRRSCRYFAESFVDHDRTFG